MLRYNARGLTSQIARSVYLIILSSIILFSSPVVIYFHIQVLAATSMPSMYDRLKDSNDLLDQINKGLNAYLEKKRLFFSRLADSFSLFLNATKLTYY